MKCFYHNDSDGHCAAFWVALSAGLTDYELGYDQRFIEMDYRKQFPFDIVQPCEMVYIVDYSISPDEMRTLLQITSNVTWIDHHKTAIQKYENFEYPVRGVRYDGVSGCMLTYCYLHHMTSRGEGEILPFDIKMIEYAPLFTKLIDDWDVWKFTFGDDTRHFQTAIYTYDTLPRSDFWNKMLEGKEQEVINQGKTMIKYRDSWAASYMSLGFETEFEGHLCYTVNLGRCNSEYFKSLPDGKYEIFIPFVFDGEQYIISFYSKTVDVSQIAKKYGGGGHAGASGCTVKELPFKKKIP